MPNLLNPLHPLHPLTFFSQVMDELKLAFSLEDKDLNLNLGPLGNLM